MDGKPMRARRPRTWEDIYYAAVRRGDDPAYALFLADEWQKRQERKAAQQQKEEADDAARQRA